MHTKRIARGARWLDKQTPDWYERIRRPLDQSDTGCVIGQVHGDFGDFMCRRYRIPDLDRLPVWVVIPIMILYPPVWAGIIFSIRKGFLCMRETNRQWADAWGGEINKRRDANTLYVPESWELAKERQFTNV